MNISCQMQHLYLILHGHVISLVRKFSFILLKSIFYVKPKGYAVDMMDACGSGSPMVITIQNNTVIKSPNFPENYPNYMDCNWHIVADHERGIELSVKGHELENEYDLLVVLSWSFFYILNKCNSS